MDYDYHETMKLANQLCFPLYAAARNALKLLLVGPEFTQVAVKTEKAAGQLKWIRSDRVTRLEPERRRAEQEAYDASLAQILQEIVSE